MPGLPGPKKLKRQMAKKFMRPLVELSLPPKACYTLDIFAHNIAIKIFFWAMDFND